MEAACEGSCLPKPNRAAGRTAAGQRRGRRRGVHRAVRAATAAPFPAVCEVCKMHGAALAARHWEAMAEVEPPWLQELATGRLQIIDK